MPVHGLDQAVDVLEELPREPALADPGLADDRHEPGAAFAAGRLEHVLEQAQVLLAPDERRLELVAAARPATLRDDPQCAPRPDAFRLALHGQLAQRLVRDRAVGRPIRPLADEDAVGLGATLQARRGVHDVAGDHALAGGAHGHGGLAGGHAGADREARRVRVCEREGADRVDELERGSDRALRVVLVGGGRAPHGDHGVADELLHDAAVPLRPRSRRARSSGRASRGRPPGPLAPRAR